MALDAVDQTGNATPIPTLYELRDRQRKLVYRFQQLHDKQPTRDLSLVLTAAIDKLAALESLR